MCIVVDSIYTLNLYNISKGKYRSDIRQYR